MFKFLNNSEASETTEEPSSNTESYKLSARDFLNELRTAQEQPFVFDLREQDEFETSHFYNAHSLPFEYLENMIYRMPYSGKIFFYANDGETSRQAVEMLIENGFEEVFYLESYQSLIEELKQATFEIEDPARVFIHEALSQGLEGTFQLSATPISLKNAKFAITLQKEINPSALLLQNGDIEMYTDTDSLLFLEGIRIVVNNQDGEQSLSVEHPDFTIPPLPENAEEVLIGVIDNQINPMVEQHNGYVKFVGLDDDRAILEFGGGCKGCSGVSATLKYGVTNTIQEYLPGIAEVLDITDHANGTNPYYTA